MTHHLVLHVRLHEGRYHGSGDWPPSPARAFQALVAGAGLSGPIGNVDRRVFEWLERLGPPIVASPYARDGQSFEIYVPGNDLDKLGGDPKRIAATRDGKPVRPRLFDATVPFLYAWQFEGSGEDEPDRVCALAERLYQFGRGVDLAWAWGEVLDSATFDDLLADYPGAICRPSRSGRGQDLACPDEGSFDSLETRYRSPRFATERTTRTVRRVFSRPPAPRFVLVPYDSPCERFIYDLRERSAGAPFTPWSPTRTTTLVTMLRDLAVDRLRGALPERSAEIDRVLVGRKPDGTNSGPTSARVRIIPLPSIGHAHADDGTRRVLVEVPADCPLRPDDVEWAFSGLNLVDRETGELLNTTLSRAQSPLGERMLGHYGIDKSPSRIWRTVTPAALSHLPRRPRGRAGSSVARMRKTGEAVQAVHQALRHAGVRQHPASIGVQREPFASNGERAEAFAAGTRFGGDRLWHVEIAFTDGVTGPLIIGDGRFLGLGLMAPERQG